MNIYLDIYFVLILTIITEFLVYLIFIRKNILRLFLYSILINSFTNPLANLVYGFGVNIFLIEFIVFVVEIFLIKLLFKMDYKKVTLISFVANLASFIIGVLLF